MAEIDLQGLVEPHAIMQQIPMQVLCSKSEEEH